MPGVDVRVSNWSVRYLLIFWTSYSTWWLSNDGWTVTSRFYSLWTLLTVSSSDSKCGQSGSGQPGRHSGTASSAFSSHWASNVSTVFSRISALISLFLWSSLCPAHFCPASFPTNRSNEIQSPHRKLDSPVCQTQLHISETESLSSN